MSLSHLPIKRRIKKFILNCLEDLYDFMWGDFSLLGKLLILFFVYLPIIFLTMAFILNAERDTMPNLFGLASLSSLIIGTDLIIFFCYMMGSLKRRRILYVLIAVGVWIIYGLARLFSDDPDTHERMLNMAIVGSVWFMIPMFLSFFTFIPVIIRKDD